VKFGSPSEYDRGTPPDRFVTGCSPPARADGSGYASRGVLRPYDVLLRVPRSATTELAPAAGGEECHCLAGAALGLSQPLGGFSRDDAREPGLPRTHASRRRYARSGAALFHAATPLGFALQSLPLPESRAAFRRPDASLRVRSRPMTGTNAPAISDRFHPRAPPEPRAHPCGPPRDRSRETRAPRDRHVRSPCPTRELPLAELPIAPTSNDRPERSGIAGSRPHARFEALLPPRVRSRGRPRLLPRLARQSLRPFARRSSGPVLSWAFAPPEPSPPRPRVRSTASPARGEPDGARKTTPHSGSGERRFDPEV
jgi:hypothetical protein